MVDAILLAKYSTCVLQISHMVSSGSLLSCDAMLFTVGSHFLVKNAFFGGRYFFHIYSNYVLLNSEVPEFYKQGC